MLIGKDYKVGALIDGSNIYAATKHLGFDVDYSMLLKVLKSKGQLVRAMYFTAVREDEEYSTVKPLIDWLSYNGYRVVTKATVEHIDERTGQPKIKGNMDIEICIKGLLLAEHVDHIYLFTGDGDFTSMVEAMQDHHGVQVTVVSHMGHKGNYEGKRMCLISDKLRRQADVYIDLLDIQGEISKQESSHVLRRQR